MTQSGNQSSLSRTHRVSMNAGITNDEEQGFNGYHIAITYKARAEK